MYFQKKRIINPLFLYIQIRIKPAKHSLHLINGFNYFSNHYSTGIIYFNVRKTKNNRLLLSIRFSNFAGVDNNFRVNLTNLDFFLCLMILKGNFNDKERERIEAYSVI